MLNRNPHSFLGTSAFNENKTKCSDNLMKELIEISNNKCNKNKIDDDSAIMQEFELQDCRAYSKLLLTTVKECKKSHGGVLSASDNIGWSDRICGNISFWGKGMCKDRVKQLHGEAITAAREYMANKK